MRMRFSFVVLVCAVLVVGFVGVAHAIPTPPFDTNVECLECHDVALGGPAVSKVDFQVAGSVGLERCATCHNGTGYLGAAHAHFTGACQNCHNNDDAFYFSWPGSRLFPVNTAYGYFTGGLASLAVPPAQLHAIHSGVGWVESTFASSYPSCSNCHASSSCSACHVQAVPHTAHATPAYPAVAYKQSTGTAVTFAPSTCVNASCHAVAASGTSGFVPLCTRCHAEKASEHGYDNVDHVADDSTVSGIACTSCHAMDLSTEHNKTSSSSTGSGCSTCHPTPRSSFGAWDQSCVTGGCHTVTSAAPYHASTSEAHAVVPAGDVCIGCHTGSDLGSIHADATSATGSTSCLVCHSAGGTPATNDCTVCHFTFDAHYDSVAHTSTWTLATCDSSGCHTTRDLMGVHAEHNPAFTCHGCHASADGNVTAAIAAGNTACDSCHIGLSQDSGHRAIHWASPLLQDADGPNYSYWTGSMGAQPTGDCAGCHTSNIVDEHMGVVDAETGNTIRPARADSAGNALTCASCHNSLDGTVRSAIALGQTGCDACHVTHGPINQVHSSAFATAPVVDCAGCHDANLVNQHDGGYTVVTPSGRSLTGCDVCHAYYEGSRGAQVQAAISVMNDTLCSACHAVEHVDLGSHKATSSASVTGCGRCHPSGSATSLDIQGLHVTADSGPCAVCHSNPARVPDITTKTGECVSCHATQGTDYHLQASASHTFGGMDASCASAECHGSSNLPDVHERYLARYPQYTDTCALCHLNENPTRIDWSSARADCSSCHEVHGDIAAIHTTTSDALCVNCHDSADVRDLHPACSTCHNDTVDTSAGASCASCHADAHPDRSGAHTAIAPASIDACGRCHDPDTAPGIGLEAIHAGSAAGPCAVCHENPARVPDIHTVSAECASCHATAGTDYHRATDAAHTFGAMAPGCVVAGCHVSDSLPAEHERFLGRYPGYTDTCALCHLNADSGRIDWATASADCSSCHEIHGDIAQIHQAPSSQACVECHETADVRDLHPTCQTCHNATVDTSGTTACANCHTRTPLDTAHYPAASHLAAETGCAGCHSMDMEDEHAKASSGPVGCVVCHETKVDAFTSAWDKKCAACHVAKHTAQAIKHVSTKTACAGSGCHVITDVSAIHAGLAGGGCPTCHKSATLPATTTDCSSVGCHVTYHAGKPTKHRAVNTASADCARCHDANPDAGTDIEPVHASAPAGPCAVCHANAVRVPDIKAKTAECASCHATTGVEYHRTMNAKHTFSGFNASCIAADCHVSASLPLEHARFLGRYPTYADTCALCHLNSSPTRINWSTASADCSTCHTVHGDVNVIHQAPGSGECTACHETADVRTIHTGGCATCHNATVNTSGTAACANAGCHATLSPPSPTKHYVAAPHLANEAGCTNCHSMDMKSEHFKTSSGPVSCVQCHENKVDSFTSAWDKTCTACHTNRHSDQQVKHRSTNTSCGGSSCHNINDASDIHKGVQGGGCSVCHQSATASASTTDCSAAGCHAGTGTNHHEAHDGNTANGAGCEGCHFRYLDDEHAALGLTCATCHSSTSTVVRAAITNRDRRCLSCHSDSPHNARQAAEFGAGNASMHRVTANLPGMRSSFLVNGATYTMSLPAASTFLRTGYTYDTMVSCASCHTYSGATGPHGATMRVNIDPAYPRTFKVTGAGQSSTAQLSANSSTGMSMSKNGSAVAGVICEKCHDLLNGSTWSNVAHKEHDDRGSDGAYCNQCHVAVPHGWGRPRLIGYTTDAAPYRTWVGSSSAQDGGLQRISLKSYTPSSWNKPDCGAGCSSGRHPLSGSSWPNVMSSSPAPTTGVVSGTVTAASGGAAVSGAAITLGAASTTTAANGTYSFATVAPGTYTLTVAKTGYTTSTSSVTVVAGQTATANVSLQATGTGTNLLLNRSFSASRYENSTYAPGKAGDGSDSTWWWSDDRGYRTRTEWLRGDIGSRTSVSRVEVVWYGSYYASEFRVYTSTDGSSWTQVYSTTSGGAGTSVVTFSARDARYIKLECRRTGSGSSNGYGVAELRAFQ